ncbi:hypothetical protein PFFVO_04961 [Plasmodium falciparum Vietnam Oak-Knoll (FVO)]|uniref:Uncharacterized protein n=1 Tax=Plasmodium falciparum Vietnam Oak-Knoll (FVO) TaxID=1036723 RepID=A0A024V1Q3_PLAFA|nr:hypothetical protein PFFVO_04961 [Plasmodium falciparum Vietnam Oak-Knoll (FVO)]
MENAFFFKYKDEQLLEHILINFIYKKKDCLKNIFITNGNDKDLFFERNIFNYIYSYLFKTSKIKKTRIKKNDSYLLNNKRTKKLLYLDCSKNDYQRKRNIYIGNVKRRGIYNNIPSSFYKLFRNKKKMKYIQSLYVIIKKLFLIIMNKKGNFNPTIRYLFLLKNLMNIFYKYFSIYIIRYVYIKYNNNNDNNNNDIIIKSYNSKRKKCSIKNFLFLYFKNMKSSNKLTDEYMFMKNYLLFIFIINEIFYIYIWLLYVCLHKYTYDTKKIYLLLKIIGDDNYGSFIFSSKQICTYKRKDTRHISFFLFLSRKNYMNEREKLKYKNYKRIICFVWIYKIIKNIHFLVSLYNVICNEKEHTISLTMYRKYILLLFILKILKIIKIYSFQSAHPFFFTTVKRKDILNNNNYYYNNKSMIKRKYYLKVLHICHIIYEQFIFLLSKKKLYLYFELFFILNSKRYNKKEEFNSYRFSRTIIYNIINNNNYYNYTNVNIVDRTYYKHNLKNKQNKYTILLLYLYYKIYEHFLELYKKDNEWYPKKKKDNYYIMKCKKCVKCMKCKKCLKCMKCVKCKKCLKCTKYAKYKKNISLLSQKNSFFVHLIHKYFVLFILLYSINRKTNITLHFIKTYIQILFLISQRKNLFAQFYFYKINLLTYFLYCINQIIISKQNNYPNYCIELKKQRKQNYNIRRLYEKEKNNSHITYNKKSTTLGIPSLKLKKIEDMLQKKSNVKENNDKEYYYKNKTKKDFFFKTIFKCTHCIFSFKRNIIYPTLFSTKMVVDYLNKNVKEKTKKKKKKITLIIF